MGKEFSLTPPASVCGQGVCGCRLEDGVEESVNERGKMKVTGNKQAGRAERMRVGVNIEPGTLSFEQLVRCGGQGATKTYTNDNEGVLGMARHIAADNIQRLYYLFDDLGSVTAMTDSEGMPVKYYHYDPYGNVVNTETDPHNMFTFVGRYGGQRDFRLRLGCGGQGETGFVQFLHRWYDAQTGKWLSRDPIGVEGGVNLYAYTDNNPVNRVDPAGLCHTPKAKPLPEADLSGRSERVDYESYVTYGNYCGKDYTAGKWWSQEEQNTHGFYSNFMYVRPKDATDSCCYRHDLCAYKVRVYGGNKTERDCDIELVNCVSVLSNTVSDFINWYFTRKINKGAY